MTGERYPPDDPREWLNRAHNNLRLARTVTEGIHVAQRQADGELKLAAAR